METERLVIAVNPDIKKEFHKATRQNGSNMTVEVNRFIREYINRKTKELNEPGN